MAQAQGKQNEIVARVEKMLMSEIEPDWNWNVRKHTGEVVEDPEKELGPENDTGFTGLVKSIEVEGQKDAVEVRPTPKGHPSKKPYLLTSGFRRFKALLHIAAKTGDKSPTIKAIVKACTEEQARIRNIEENTGRKDLMGADYVYGIAELRKLSPGMTQARLGELFGLKQGYVSQLLKIATNVKTDLRDQWRDDVATKVSIVDMVKLAEKPEAEQDEAYEALRKAKAERTSNKTYDGKVKTYLDRVTSEAKNLGALVHSGAIVISDENAFFDFTTEHETAKVSTIVAFAGKPPVDGDKSNTKELTKYRNAAKEAFHKVADAEAPKTDAPVDPKASAKSAKKAANGSRAQA